MSYLMWIFATIVAIWMFNKNVQEMGPVAGWNLDMWVYGVSASLGVYLWIWLLLSAVRLFERGLLWLRRPKA